MADLLVNEPTLVSEEHLMVYTLPLESVISLLLTAGQRLVAAAEDEEVLLLVEGDDCFVELVAFCVLKVVGAFTEEDDLLDNLLELLCALLDDCLEEAADDLDALLDLAELDDLELLLALAELDDF